MNPAGSPRPSLTDIFGDLQAPRRIFRLLTPRHNRLLRLYRSPRIRTAEPADEWGALFAH